MFLSEILALGAATCIAISSMLIGELRGRLGLIRLARWQMVTAFALTAGVSLALGGWRSIEPWQFAYLAASSLFGIVIASTTYFAAIYAAGAQVTALMFSLTAPFALVLGYFVLGEAITGQQGIGVALVLAGIVLAIGLPIPSRGAIASPRVSLAGIGLGAVTALGQALGSLAAWPAMAAGVEPFTAMAIRSGLAAAIFLLIAVLPIEALRQRRREPWPLLAIAVASAVVGTGLGMSLLMAALAHGSIGIVSTLSSITPVIILPMVWLRTGRRPPAMAWAGAAMAVAGTALISL